MPRRPSYLPQTTDALRLLGLQVAEARRRRRRTLVEVADRAGIDVKTLRKVERGEPNVAVGTVFEVASLLGVDLFGVDATSLPALVRRQEDRVALLPSRVVVDRPVDDAF